MTFGSLFAGIGGLDLGLERAGMECRWQVEINPFCQKVLAKHWPNVRRYGDITQLTGDELERVDLVCGGFPCQDLSQAGKRAGIEGSRSGLWFDYARLLGILRPRYVLIENVAGLLVDAAMRRVVGELARLGYVGLWQSLRASDFGASHQRKRIFVVAYRRHGGIDLGAWPAGRTIRERTPERHGSQGDGADMADASPERNHGTGGAGSRWRSEYSDGSGSLDDSACPERSRCGQAH